MPKLYTTLKCFFVLTLCNISYAQENSLVYKSNSNYHYRIPAITVDKTSYPNALYAFAEKRHRDTNTFCKDSGEIDIVMKSSLDNGISWSTETIVIGNKPVDTNIDQYQAYTNPTVLYGKDKIHLMFNTHLKHQCAVTVKKLSTSKLKKGDRKFWYSYSIDNGKTWSKAVQIFIPLILRERVDMVGPGNGILTKDEEIIFPAAGKNLVSNDYGKSWSVTKVKHGGSEATVVELCDGRLMRNDRPGFNNTKFLLDNNKPNNRVYSVSNKKGDKWSKWQAMRGVIMPTNPWVQASLIKVGCTPNNETILAFSTPNHPRFRENMSVFISQDSGKTWKKKQQLTKEKNDYSSLIKLPNERIGILYEDGFGVKSIRYSHLSIRKY